MIKPKLGTVTVTFHPDVSILRLQLARLPPEAVRIIVDNASGAREREALRALAVEAEAILLENTSNTGLAAATNRGIARALSEGCDRVLLLDQDTEPDVGAVDRLCAAQDALRGAGHPPACVGPRLVDIATGLEHGFHQIRGWRWERVHPGQEEAGIIACANLNGSGTLAPREILEALGGGGANYLEEAFFIDHVDTEWAFRVLAAGYWLRGVPDASFRHRMGERSWRFWWWGWRVWPYRSPFRHRFLFRNAARLLRRNYVPRVWKVWALPKLFITLLAHGVFDHRRAAQVTAMVQGFAEGWREDPKGEHD